MPTMLSQTGLYDDVPSGRLAPGVRTFEPRYALWSDGATKKRWVYLPPGSQIDTSDMDYWKYPAGTKLWKEFTRDGKRVETRLLYKTGADATSWFMMAFLWNDAQTDAMAVPDGVVDALGTPHDVPAQLKCLQCHNGLPDRALGLTAIQLAHDVGEVNLGVLQREGRLTANGAAMYPLPGDATAQAALGYLHANCGGCHNAKSAVHVLVDMELRLTTATLGAVAMTPTYRTTVNVVPGMVYMGDTHRITPGDPTTSGVHIHMSGRSSATMTWKQMPPIGTEVVDATGLSAVDAWISAVR